MECKRDYNLENCSCSKKECERNGRCCECVAYHRGLDELPSCLRYQLKKD